MVLSRNGAIASTQCTSIKSLPDATARRRCRCLIGARIIALRLLSGAVVGFHQRMYLYLHVYVEELETVTTPVRTKEWREFQDSKAAER